MFLFINSKVLDFEGAFSNMFIDDKTSFKRGSKIGSKKGSKSGPKRESKKVYAEKKQKPLWDGKQILM